MVMAVVRLHCSRARQCAHLFLIVLVLAVHSTIGATDASACDTLRRGVFNSTLRSEDPLNSMVVRYVHPNGTNNSTCLCRPLTPCRTIEYALYGDNTTVDGDATPLDNQTTPIANVTVVLGSGIHRLDHDSGITLHAYHDVHFVGVDGTIIQCGQEPDFEDCSLGNVHIRDSSRIYFSSIVFQNCMPQVPMIFVEQSEDVVFENCIFK